MSTIAAGIRWLLFAFFLIAAIVGIWTLAALAGLVWMANA